MLKVNGYESISSAIRIAGGLAAFSIGLAACASESKTAVRVKSSDSTTPTVETLLSRSYQDQPLLVKSCPKGGRQLSLGGGVQAHLLGQLGVEPNYIVIGDGSPEPVYEYDTNVDGIPEGWCGEIADVFDKNTHKYSPSPNRQVPAHLFIPNWMGCKLPVVGGQLECQNGPLVFDPLPVSRSFPNITVQINIDPSVPTAVA